MVSVRVTHTLADLQSDLEKIAVRAPKDMRDVVARTAKSGNRLAKGYAAEQHTMDSAWDVQYAPSFTTEQITPLRWEYGPDASIGGGGAASGYEWGSRNSPPHLDLNRSADIIGPLFATTVRGLLDDWFWPA